MSNHLQQPVPNIIRMGQSLSILRPDGYGLKARALRVLMIHQRLPVANEMGQAELQLHFIVPPQDLAVLAEGCRMPTSVGRIGLPNAVHYDAKSQVTQMTGASGHTVIFGYDVLGQLTAVSLPDGSTAQTRAYDAAGSNFIAITDSSGNVTRHLYDAVQQLLQTTYAAVSPEFGVENLVGG